MINSKGKVRGMVTVTVRDCNGNVKYVKNGFLRNVLRLKEKPMISKHHNTITSQGDETIALYHDRRKQLSAQEIGDTQEITADQIIASATLQAENILKDLNEDKERFRKLGLTFEEMAFYDILLKMRDEKDFEYGEDVFDADVGIMVNKKIQKLAKKIKELIDLKSSFTDWLNNTNVRNQLKSDIKFCLFDNGYPPIYSQEVFNQVMEQVENYKTYEEE